MMMVSGVDKHISEYFRTNSSESDTKSKINNLTRKACMEYSAADDETTGF